MVKSKKQEIFRKLNSTSGVGDSDVGKWVFPYNVPLNSPSRKMQRFLVIVAGKNP